MEVTAPRRCLLWRPAGIGDALWLTPVLPLLAADGWTVDVCVDRGPAAVFEQNPHVRAVLAMEDQRTPDGRTLYMFPNDRRYLSAPAVFDWQATLADRYEKLIGVGGWLETHYVWRERDSPLEYQLTQAERQTDAVFQDEIIRFCGYNVRGLRPCLYPSPDERQWLADRRPDEGLLLVWHLAGSAYHKVLPNTAAYLNELLDRERALHVWALSDGPPRDAWLRSGVRYDHWARITWTGGSAGPAWTLRQQLLAPSVADVVVGPDSSVTNAAAAFLANVVVVCSHIGPANLTRWWANCEAVTSLATCQPCFRAWDNPEPSCFTVPGQVRSGARCCTLLPADFLSRIQAMLHGTDGRRCPACGLRLALNEPTGGFRCLGCGVGYGGPERVPYSARGRFRPTRELVPVEAPAPPVELPAPPEDSTRAAHVAVEQLTERDCQVIGLIYNRPELLTGEGLTVGVASPLARRTLLPVLRAVLDKVEQTEEPHA